MLLVASVGAIVLAERPDDGLFWWERGDLTPYERKLVEEIRDEIFDRYFRDFYGAMTSWEFVEKWHRLFAQYAEKRGLEVPEGMAMPYLRPLAAREGHPIHLTAADVTYWWELVGPECREANIWLLKQEWERVPERFPEWFPEFPSEEAIMRMTPEELNLILSPPPPPLRLLSIEDRKEGGWAPTAFLAIYGRARSYEAQAEIEEWLNRLRDVQDKISDWLIETCHYSGEQLRPTSGLGVCPTGYLSVWLNADELTKDEALALATKMYPVIAEKARAAGIDDIPVAFKLLAFRTDGGTRRFEKHRPIIGGVQMSRPRLVGEADDPRATVGFSVRHTITQERGYLITGHLGFLGRERTRVGTQIYQPWVCRWWPWRHRAGQVAAVARRYGFADVARVAFADVTYRIYDGRPGLSLIRAVWGTRVPEVGLEVHMSGITTSSPNRGTITEVGRMIPIHPAFGRLYGQVVATYARAGSDSGAPVFWLRDGRTFIVGIHSGGLYDGWGRPIAAVLSPMSGIQNELGRYLFPYSVFCPPPIR